MSQVPITQFELDPDRLAVLKEFTEDYVGEADGEWPHNVLSKRTVVYGSGRIARSGETISHAVSPSELALCRQLSSEIAALMEGTDVGMGSNSSDKFYGFFIAGNVGESVPEIITEAMIWERFGGTIFPPTTVDVEALAEKGAWWRDVDWDGQDSGDEYFKPWRRMIEWFKGRAEFVDAAFVRIGDENSMGIVPDEEYPAGTEWPGCVFPRLALGLTTGGSLVGLCGVCVQA